MRKRHGTLVVGQFEISTTLGWVIPMARAFTSGPRDLPCNGFLQGDPSLRLKNGFARDDATWRDGFW